MAQRFSTVRSFSVDYLRRHKKKVYSDKHLISVGRLNKVRLEKLLAPRTVNESDLLCQHCYKYLQNEIASPHNVSTSDSSFRDSDEVLAEKTFTEDDLKRIYLCSAPQNDCFLRRCEKCPKMQSISLQSLHLDEDEEICYALWDAGELVKKANICLRDDKGLTRSRCIEGPTPVDKRGITAPSSVVEKPRIRAKSSVDVATCLITVRARLLKHGWWSVLSDKIKPENQVEGINGRLEPAIIASATIPFVFAGLDEEKVFHVIIDAYTKCLEV
ncbi:hypothetical protein ISCGN_007070 [Ixodes scapularis]